MDKLNNEPNIFNYATSELSQDAFICYLLSFAENNYKNEEEYKIAKKFLKKCGIEEDIKSIKRQYKKIDVLIETENFVLVIEDKIYTEEHDDQIIKYVNKIKEDSSLKNKTIKVCYYKIGNYVKDYEPKKENSKILKKMIVFH